MIILAGLPSSYKNNTRIAKLQLGHSDFDRFLPAIQGDKEGKMGVCSFPGLLIHHPRHRI